MSIHNPKKNENVKHRFRRADNGQMTTENYSKSHPKTTIKESYIVKKKKP